MKSNYYRFGLAAGVVSGIALGLVQWVAFVCQVLPYNIYTLTAGLVLPAVHARTLAGSVAGLVGHALSSGLLGIVFAAVVRDRKRKAVTWGTVYGFLILILLAGFFLEAFTGEPAFWRLPAVPLIFTVAARLFYGAFLGCLYMFLLARGHRVRT